eukprot:TRINITY_DN6123_c0_g1_i13.p2 TRINITY_DN6123_c0_g1~~TRINITY_DN6123_c0_g1_i13.p2  ORF type:complete len:288 (+),score=41.88 TRINITY_DN6123_c0_g1_i13:714-1577(+)
MPTHAGCGKTALVWRLREGAFPVQPPPGLQQQPQDSAAARHTHARRRRGGCVHAGRAARACGGADLRPGGAGAGGAAPAAWCAQRAAWTDTAAVCVALCAVCCVLCAGLLQGMYRGCQGVVVAYDVGDRASFAAVPGGIALAREHAPGAVVAVAGCKSDRDAAQRTVGAGEAAAVVGKLVVPELWLRERERAMQAAAHSTAGHVECSAATGAGVEAVFRAVAVGWLEQTPGPWQVQARSLRAVCVARLRAMPAVSLQRLPGHLRAEIAGTAPQTAWQRVAAVFGLVV